MIKTINLRKLIPAILLPVFVGVIASLFTSNSSQVYSGLNRPALSPPAIVFPFVWTFLYVIIGIASYFFEESNCSDKKRIRQYYLIGLALNLLWPIIFFALQWYLVAAIEILVLVVFTAITTYYFYNCDKYAGYLFIPYLLWLLFATYLNFGVVALN